MSEGPAPAWQLAVPILMGLILICPAMVIDRYNRRRGVADEAHQKWNLRFAVALGSVLVVVGVLRIVDQARTL